jgi:hypothetical protein
MWAKLLLAAGVVAVVVYWFIGKFDKAVDYQTRATVLESRQLQEDVMKKSMEISSGRAVEDPDFEARKAERQKELTEIDQRLKKDRFKADTHVDRAELHAEEMEEGGASKQRKLDPLDVFAQENK